jgi:hypothetical protein
MGVKTRIEAGRAERILKWPVTRHFERLGGLASVFGLFRLCLGGGVGRVLVIVGVGLGAQWKPTGSGAAGGARGWVMARNVIAARRFAARLALFSPKALPARMR